MKNSGAILAVVTVVSVFAVVIGKPANNDPLQKHHIDTGLEDCHSEHNIIRREVLLSDVELNESPVVYEEQFNANKVRLRRQVPTETQPNQAMLGFIPQIIANVADFFRNLFGFNQSQTTAPSKNENSIPNKENVNTPTTGANENQSQSTAPSTNENSIPNTETVNTPTTGANETPGGTPIGNQQLGSIKSDTTDGSANTGTGAGFGTGSDVKTG